MLFPDVNFPCPVETEDDVHGHREEDSTQHTEQDKAQIDTEDCHNGWQPQLITDDFRLDELPDGGDDEIEQKQSQRQIIPLLKQ